MNKYIDKILHLLAGFAIATLFQFMGIWSLIPVIVAGTGKELYDKHQEGRFDVVDLLCTFAGGFAGYWFTIVIHA